MTIHERPCKGLGVSALTLLFLGCGSDGPTIPEETYDVEILLQTVEVLEDCEDVVSDSPGEWTWRLALGAPGRPSSVLGTADYPDPAGSVLWRDGQAYGLDEGTRIAGIALSHAASVTLTLEATEWDLSLEHPPRPDANMNGKTSEAPVLFVLGTLEHSIALADETGKCSIRISYSATWRAS